MTLIISELFCSTGKGTGQCESVSSAPACLSRPREGAQHCGPRAKPKQAPGISLLRAVLEELFCLAKEMSLKLSLSSEGLPVFLKSQFFYS